MPTADAPELPPPSGSQCLNSGVVVQRSEEAVYGDEDMLGLSAGSLLALESLYNRHGGRCLALARSVLDDADLAEAAVSEAFLDAWRGAASFDAARLPVVSWLLVLTHRRSVGRLRRERARTDPLGPLPQPSEPGAPAGARAVPPLDRSRLALLHGLPDTQRQCLLLAYWGGYKVSEISVMTSTPAETVRQRCRAGLIGLRRSMVSSDQDRATQPVVGRAGTVL